MACPETKWPSAKEYMADFAARTEKLKVPLSGSLELTHRCNLNCVHCYLGPRDARLALKGRELGTSRGPR